MSGHSATCPARGGCWKDCKNPLCGVQGMLPSPCSPRKVPPFLDRGLFPAITDFPLKRPLLLSLFMNCFARITSECVGRHNSFLWSKIWIPMIEWQGLQVQCVEVTRSLREDISDFGFLRLPTRLFRRLVHTLREHSSLPYIVPLKNPKLSLWYWFQWELWRPS